MYTDFYGTAACAHVVLITLPFVSQGEYGSAGLEASYSGGQAAFAAAYGGQAGYPSAATGISGRDAYGGTNLYSQGFAASQVLYFAMPNLLQALPVCTCLMCLLDPATLASIHLCMLLGSTWCPD